VNLLWTPSGRDQAGDNEAEPSLFTAIEEQLGLKLEAKKGLLEILVVDSADKVPTEN
jgi:uncharacterized protein (TIGR03435 family)